MALAKLNDGDKQLDSSDVSPRLETVMEGGTDDDEDATLSDDNHLEIADEDEDENDTLNDSHSKASHLQDDSMKTANEDRSSRHAEDSDCESFVSCRSENYKALAQDDGESDSDSDSESDSTGSDHDITASEYSESMGLESLRRELEYTSEYKPRRQGLAQEGAPSFKIPGPGEKWPVGSVTAPLAPGGGPGHASASAVLVGRASGLSFDSPISLGYNVPPSSNNESSGRLGGAMTPPRRPSSSRAGRGLPGGISPTRASGGLFGRGRPSGGRGLGGPRYNTASFSRSFTDETKGPRRPLVRSSTSERTMKTGDKEDDGKPKFKRKLRSRSMDMGSFIRNNDIDRANQRRESNSHSRISLAFGATREQAHHHPRVIRKSRKLDIQTGGEVYREVVCQRIIDYPDAMNPAERRRKTVLRTGTEARGFTHHSSHGAHHEPQYRLYSRLHAHGFKDHVKTQSIRPGALTTYLIWSLKSNFFVVLLSEALAFWIVTIIFAICIYLGAVYQPECLRFPDGNNFEEFDGSFLDAFAMSWTTFSTVGYGIVYPQVRKEPDASSFHCAFMTTITALEAFVGVLFASFCGAVIVGKMARARSTAAIRFSQRMTLRFGSGVMYTDDDDVCGDRTEKPVSDYEKKRLLFPCPVLEFRLANTLFANAGGEIMNSKISVVSSTLADREPDSGSLRNSVTGMGFGSVMAGVTGVGGRPSLQMIKGMTQSASQFLKNSVKRPFSDTSSENVWSSSGSLFSSSGNMFSSAGSIRKVNGSDPQSSSFRNMLWSAAGNKSRTNSSMSGESDAEPKSKGSKTKSVLKMVSKVGKDAIESVVLKKKVMRSTKLVTKLTDEKKEEAKEEETSIHRRNAICVEEDPTGGLIPRKLFSSLKIESETHPFFKRVWTIRHVLNEDSPLLSERARAIVKMSRGMWPAETCHHSFIRKNVDFQQLIVSMSGTTTGNNVYGLHVYEYRNLHVGYCFAPILSIGMDGKMEVDLDRIDNICEQRGGGAEPVNYHELTASGDINDINDAPRLPRKRNVLQRREKPLVEEAEGGNSDSGAGMQSIVEENAEDCISTELSLAHMRSITSMDDLTETHNNISGMKAVAKPTVSFDNLANARRQGSG